MAKCTRRTRERQSTFEYEVDAPREGRPVDTFEFFKIMNVEPQFGVSWLYRVAVDREGKKCSPA